MNSNLIDKVKRLYLISTCKYYIPDYVCENETPSWFDPQFQYDLVVTPFPNFNEIEVNYRKKKLQFNANSKLGARKPLTP